MHLDDRMPQRAQAVNHTLAVPGIDEHGIRLVLDNGPGDMPGQRHVVRAVKDLGLMRDQPLPQQDDAVVIAEPGHVHADNLRRKQVIRFVVAAPRGVFHVSNAHQLVVAGGCEVAQVLTGKSVLAHVGPQPDHFCRVNRLRVVNGVAGVVPVRLGLGVEVQAAEQVQTLGSPDEQRPSLAV